MFGPAKELHNVAYRSYTRTLTLRLQAFKECLLRGLKHTNGPTLGYLEPQGTGMQLLAVLASGSRSGPLKAQQRSQALPHR